jgi:hypothetical protein
LNAGAALSVFGSCNLDRSISLNGAVRQSTSCSIRGGLTIGSALSVREFAHYGSSLPVAGFVRLGSVGAFSTTAELTVSSSLSMRSFIRFGSTCSVSTEISLSVSFLARAAVNVPSSGQVLATQGLDILASRLGSSLSGMLALDAHTFEALTSLWYMIRFWHVRCPSNISLQYYNVFSVESILSAIDESLLQVSMGSV